MNERIHEIWTQTASAYTTDQELIEELWEEIKSKYSPKTRYYHNLDHLDYMLEQAVSHKEDIREYNLLILAIFYHDLIYDIDRKDNERKSAEAAGKRLEQLGLSSEDIEHCQKLILATEHHHTQGENDIKYLLDFDLAVLGESPEDYENYRQNIRKEYSQYPDPIFSNGRRNFVRKFLEKERIFHTDEYFRKYEKQARKNLLQEIGEN